MLTQPSLWWVVVARLAGGDAGLDLTFGRRHLIYRNSEAVPSYFLGRNSVSQDIAELHRMAICSQFRVTLQKSLSDRKSFILQRNARSSN